MLALVQGGRDSDGARPCLKTRCRALLNIGPAANLGSAAPRDPGAVNAAPEVTPRYKAPPADVHPTGRRFVLEGAAIVGTRIGQ